MLITFPAPSSQRLQTPHYSNTSFLPQALCIIAELYIYIALELSPRKTFKVPKKTLSPSTAIYIHHYKAFLGKLIKPHLPPAVPPSSSIPTDLQREHRNLACHEVAGAVSSSSPDSQ